MKNVLLVILYGVLIAFSCNSQTTIEESKIKTGADNYQIYLPIFKNKNIGLLTNQTGIVEKNDTTKMHLVDFLIENKISLLKIYAPEHGFRGTADAGEFVKDGRDSKTGIPVISLYGNSKKPSREQLSGIDLMVFDLQDVGVRFYTYISSLHYLMEACAENQIPLIILDRPNPNINIIDGPILEKEHTSFVGMHPVPVLYGMTIGEYAQMINGEKWLKNEMVCDLKIIECTNYDRHAFYSLPIVPSPNLPCDKAINLYASLCFFEGTNVSVGRGTDKQFQIFGSPFLQNMPYTFVPKPNIGAKNPLHNGKKCHGKDLSQEKNLNKLELKWLIQAYDNTTNKKEFFNDFFVKLSGTKKLQQQIKQGLSPEEIRKTWEIDIENFKKTRQKYLIYK